jgi:hypothetical protein
MTITIHSHQRSGTMFILNNLARLFEMAGHSPGIHKSLLENIDHQDNFKMVVLRDPVDTILSIYVHTKVFRQDSDMSPSLEHLKMAIAGYVEHHKEIERHLDSLHVYKFGNLEDIVLDVASKFVKIPIEFEFLQNSDYENNPASVKGVALYNEILNSIESYSIFDPAFEIYNRLMQKASIIV